MKKTTIASLITLVTVTTLALPVSVLAAEPSLNSGGHVSFIAGSDPTDPTDPTDPENPDPGKPDPDPNPGGTAGPLSLDFVSQFEFNQQKISSETATYYANPQKWSGGNATEKPNFVQVTDNRGTFAGWNLRVKQEKQFNNGGSDLTQPGAELKGAKLTFSNAALDSIVPSEFAPDAPKSFVLTPGAEDTLVTAAQNKGMGTWVYRFGDDTNKDKSVALEVPGGTPKLATSYTTTLTWSLAALPTNP